MPKSSAKTAKTYENFSFAVDKDGIALATWDMPNRSMNVLSESSLRDLHAIIERIAQDDAIVGAVLTSGKESGFCAGADLEMMGSDGGARAKPKTREEKIAARYEQSVAFNQQFRKLETCGKPIAAALNGLALGGGLEVALCCHYRVVVNHDKIQLGLPEAKVGLLPGGGGTQRLPRLIGAQQALPLILQGTSLTPQKAHALGVVHALADDAAPRWRLPKPGFAAAPAPCSHGMRKAFACLAARPIALAAHPRSSPWPMRWCTKPVSAITLRSAIFCPASMRGCACRWMRACGLKAAISPNCRKTRGRGR